ncbi:MAG: hypothetical protein EXS18_07150 [Verrucomicrobiae bacterium]|nr:hypothetical protein [Verrucomicrobiae bacterium]
MKWFVVETQYGRNDYESALYYSDGYRQIRLPHVRGQITRKFSVLRIPIPREIGRIQWREKTIPTREQYDEFVNQIVKLAPNHADEIRALPPLSEIGHLLLQRIGPACPDIQNFSPSYVIRDSLKQRLEKILGIEFFPVYLSKVVPLKWELGEPVPNNYKRVYGYEPEDYILNGPHSPEVADQMGAFYEVVLPPALRWTPPMKKKAKNANLSRVAFEGILASRGMPERKNGLVRIAVEKFGESPWFRALPAEEEVFGAYDFVREDVYEILREPGKWTLEFKEVERF